LHLFSFLIKKKAICPLLQKKPVDKDMLKMTEELEVEKSDRTIIDKKSINNWEITILTWKDTTAVIF
jgi:hemerythrin superfamily protein